MTRRRNAMTGAMRSGLNAYFSNELGVKHNPSYAYRSFVFPILLLTVLDSINSWNGSHTHAHTRTPPDQPLLLWKPHLWVQPPSCNYARTFAIFFLSMATTKCVVCKFNILITMRISLWYPPPPPPPTSQPQIYFPLFLVLQLMCGRVVARILHGISSPCFPARGWARYPLWRRYMHVDFGVLRTIATEELLRLKVGI